MDAGDAGQHYLGDAIEMNRQLHVSVQKKQEEITALKKRNAQLMELVKQAEFYAAVLDAFTPHPDNTSECVSHPASAFTPHSHSSSPEPSEQPFGAALQPSWLESLLDHTPPEEEDERSHRILSEHTNSGVKRNLWPGDVGSPAGKKSRPDQEFLDQSELQSSETVQVFGSFHNFRVSKAAPCATSDLSRKGKCAFFKTSIREHGTVRTRVFPQGKTFTSHTPDGASRFLWIPEPI
ncbi:hypothetical protein KOW79_014223 [Hemibagrus wyckioides]|uniref:Multicilin n=1 Tax=Hemibagrus wyckioides TaxID=337641 RepID=A0A9D3NL68_9TELE|nr:hypothetical protein KOW79_014223 [Hemibagrus wyckioides]